MGLNVAGDPSSPSPVAPDGAGESSCSQEKPRLPRAEVKVEGENRWLALTQALTTQRLSIRPYTTSAARFFLHGPPGDAFPNNWLHFLAVGDRERCAGKLAPAQLRFAKQMGVLQPPQSAERVSRCIK